MLRTAKVSASDGAHSKAILYARCSTDENRQDVEVQLQELRRYATAHGWDFDEAQEYDSGFNSSQEKLQEVLEAIRRKRYGVLLVYSLDRFSRQMPSKTNRLLDEIVEQAGCRFISLADGIDSHDEIRWHILRPIMAYYANLFSRVLGEKIRAGIRRKKAKDEYEGGRPRKEIDLTRLMQVHGVCRKAGQGWRGIAKVYNQSLPRKEHISPATARRAFQKLCEGSVAENVAKIG